jgi:DNA-binding transcriptional regulator YbjK
MAAITADLKTKDLAQPSSHSLLSTSFMKFRGLEALKDLAELSRGSQKDAEVS